MLYKELTFLKNDIKRYLLVLVLLAVVIGYFIYKKIDITILMFLSFSLPGLLVSLQTVQNSVMQEKNNGMFEKLLTVHPLNRILLLKAMVSFIASVIVTFICSGAVGIFININDTIVIDSSVFICELAIALCADWTMSVLLVILYMYLNQVIVINACVMGIMMALSAFCFGVITAESMILYTAGYCATIAAAGCVLAILTRYIPNTTALK